MATENNEKNTTNDEFCCRIISPDQTQEAFDIIGSEEEWNITLPKFKRIVALFNQYVFVTVNKTSGEVIAVMSMIPTHPGQFILGNLVVKRSHRGRRHGQTLLQYGLDLHKNDTITLMSVPGSSEFYIKQGFHQVEPSHEVTYILVDRSKVVSSCNSYACTGVEDVLVTPYTDKMFEDLKAYDVQARGYDSGKYLSVVTEASDNVMNVAYSSVTGTVVGYIGGIDSHGILLIDGLYADSDMIALLLFKSILDAFPVHSQVKVQVIKSREFLVQFGTVLPTSCGYKRMSKGGTPSSVRLDKLYVVSDCDYSE